MINKPMLAVKAELEKIKYPVYATPKLDGIRCLIDEGRILSRNFKPIPSLDFNNMMEQYLDYNLDGEILILDEDDNILEFNTIQSYVMADNKPLPDGWRYVYYCFDIVEDKNKTYLSRMDDLENLNVDSNIVKLSPMLVNNEQDMLDLFGQYIEMGYEGIMLRSGDSPYKEGRSTVKEGYLLKYKPFEDAEAIINDYEELMINNNEKVQDAFGHGKRSSHKANLVGGNTFGCFVVTDIETGVQFKIGTGKPLTKEYRKQLWEIRDKLIGQVITYQSQKIGQKDAPRFPTFKGFRSEIDF